MLAKLFALILLSCSASAYTIQGNLTVTGPSLIVGATGLSVNSSGVGVGVAPSANPLEVKGASAFGTYPGTTGPANGLIVSGAVGIGTAKPGVNAKLDVNGGVNVGYPGATGVSNGLVVSGNVGIGTASPGATLDVNGTLNATHSNLMNGGSTTSNTTATATSFSVCASTVSLTTSGSKVFMALGGDWSNTTINDGCRIWILQDGAFINSETSSTGVQAMLEAVAGKTTPMGWSGFSSSTPAAGSHSWCWGIAASIGGTCSAADNTNIAFSVFEVK